MVQTRIVALESVRYGRKSQEDSRSVGYGVEKSHEIKRGVEDDSKVFGLNNQRLVLSHKRWGLLHVG